MRISAVHPAPPHLVKLVAGAFPPTQTTDWLRRIDEQYHAVDAARRAGVSVDVAIPGASAGCFIPSASSLTLEAALGSPGVSDLLAAFRHSALSLILRETLGPRLVCAVTQAWVRRQYAPANHPPLHAPHGWHQDGALGFDFSGHGQGPFPAGGLLDMLTCWVPLTACGDDAPGLEILAQRQDRLVAPANLTDSAVRAGCDGGACWRPVLHPGDALVFSGDVLHRTHVSSAMTRDRTSIELRFFPADRKPTRLKDAGFVEF